MVARRIKLKGEASGHERPFLAQPVKFNRSHIFLATDSPERARRREMRKEALRAVTMLVSIVALAFVTAVASNAQSRGGKLTADISFDFVVGNKTLAAGEYVVGKATTNSTDAVLVRSSDGSGHNAIRMTNAISANAPKKRTTLTFLRYGNTYYLSQVWIAGSAEGRELHKSKAERMAERELAKNSSEGSTAQNAKPEVVTIIADVE
jgi:hypothetical protein